jgi:sugar-specific transcriptional regulator TrmB
MNPQEEDIKILTKLGLTILQAQVYLTLSKLEKATIKTISTAAKVDRANVYRVISKLQEFSLVEKMITNPTVFKAVSINEGIPMLLERQAEERKEIEQQTKELLERHKENNKEKPPQEGCEFALVPESTATYRKIQDMMDRCQTSYNLMFYLKALKPDIDIVRVLWRNLLKKGVNVRLIAYTPEGETFPKEILLTDGPGSFEIRYKLMTPPITLTICDKKEILMNTAPFNPTWTPSLWSNNVVLVGVLQEYFDQKWDESTESID